MDGYLSYLQDLPVTSGDYPRCELADRNTAVAPLGEMPFRAVRDRLTHLTHEAPEDRSGHMMDWGCVPDDGWWEAERAIAEAYATWGWQAALARIEALADWWMRCWASA